MKHFKTISEFHEFINVPKPLHPLISVLDVGTVPDSNEAAVNMVFDFYTIAVKRMQNVKIKYGQQHFDFNEGIMSFMSPKQLLSVEVDDQGKKIKKSGWVIYIHPDFFWNTPLAKTISQYDFWDYTLHEALFLSEKEEIIIDSLIRNIDQEYNANIDQFSKPIMISHLQALLNYADRFYNRQFLIRDKVSHDVLQSLEALLDAFFESGNPVNKGLPTVQHIAEVLCLSPKYLSSLLKTLTGLNTQQHIHEKLIEKAKEKLSTTELSVSEIAYELGFEHLQSFSKLFKAKTLQSPLEFRQSFH